MHRLHYSPALARGLANASAIVPRPRRASRIRLMSPALTLARRIAQLLIGLFFYGIAIAMMIRAGLGVAPWDVLSQGISIQTGWGFGVLTIVIGVIVLLLWIPIRQKPGIGTIANVALIGPAADLGLAVIPVQTAFGLQLLVFAGGLVLLAIATGLYIGARMGPGPRDGLMTGIHARFGVKLWIVRTAIEVVVLSTGWILGGTVGLGTVAFALLIGPMVNLTIPLLRVPQAGPTAQAPATPSS